MSDRDLSDVSPDLIRAETVAERTRLVDLLANLATEQWEALSLCEGWRVREVLAHMTMPYRQGALGFLTGLVRSRFNFDRYADRQARADTARLTDEQLLSSLRDNVEHPWSPPGGGPVGALSHDVIHGLDITRPLGLPSAPPERIGLVLASSSPKSLAYFGVDLTGHRLVAEDADVSIGEGPRETTAPASDILLAVTGRIPLPA